MEMLNYATKASEFMQRLALKIVENRQRELMLDVLALRWLSEAVEESVKFRLPDGGALFGSDAMSDLDSAQKITEMFRLPFPVTLTEYYVPEGTQTLLPGNHDAPKRMCLAIDINAPILARYPGQLKPAEIVARNTDEPGAIVFSFYSVGDDWSIPPIGMFFPYQRSNARAPTPEEKARLALNNAPVSEAGIVPIMPGFMQLLTDQYGEDVAMKNVTGDAVDEINSLFQFCSIMNCANVGFGKVTASAALNKKRLKSGKLPFFDYHVLELSPQAVADKVGTHGGLGGGGTKRMHLRRGHIRRLGEGEKQRRIWVNAAVVGAADKGVLMKDYAIKVA